jgi:hypothetical protein
MAAREPTPLRLLAKKKKKQLLLLLLLLGSTIREQWKSSRCPFIIIIIISIRYHYDCDFSAINGPTSQQRVKKGGTTIVHAHSHVRHSSFKFQLFKFKPSLFRPERLGVL